MVDPEGVIQLRERTSFSQTKDHNSRKQGAICTINKLEDILVLNNVKKVHKILIQSIRLRERTSFQMVNFHKQRAMTGMVRYYTIIDFNEVDMRIYLPEKVIIHRGRLAEVNITFKGR